MYISLSDTVLLFGHSQKAFCLSKIITDLSYNQAKFYTTLKQQKKRSNSKSGVWCNGSKKPRPISNNYAMDILTCPNYHLKKFNGIKYRCYQGAHRKTEKLDTLLLFHSYQDPNNKSSQSYDFKIACLGKLNDSITT